MGGPRIHRLVTVLIALSLVTVLPGVLGHAERDTEFPDGTGQVPTYRPHSDTVPHLVVCKPGSASTVATYPAGPVKAFNEHLLNDHGCDESHIQAAVDSVTDTGTNIYVLPGTYEEQPSLAPLSSQCEGKEEGELAYKEHVDCPHAQNLIAVLGDDPADSDHKCTTEPLCDLQIEGTGASPEDVVIDNQFNKLNAIRADRADGFYLRNVTVQKTEFNSVYVLETDGFVLDRTVTRFNVEYGILVFAVDHGLIRDCEAYGNGDAGIYPGSASDLKGVRPAVEITGCDSHHNLLGYSGTAGNSVLVHGNTFRDNAAGLAMDSVFPDHPGLPQDSAIFVNNRIFSNNQNYYQNFLGDDPICEKDPSLWNLDPDKPEDVTVCPTAPVPVGTGILTAGGNANLFAENWIFDNHRYGTMLFSVPAIVREEIDPTKQLDTSHFNRYIGNHMGESPNGDFDPNGIDFWWDEGGAGNCWQDNHPGSATDGSGVQSNPPAPLLPSCDRMPVQTPPNLAKLASIVSCATFDEEDNHHPPGCPWMESPAEPESSDDVVSDLLR